MACPGDTQQAIGIMERLAGDPSYRDTVSQFLKPAVHLLGADLIRKGFLESEVFHENNAAIYTIGRLIQEAEDSFQRVPVPHQWDRPKAGKLGEIAGQIWEGSLDEDMSRDLGREAVNDLLNLWQECSRASEVLRTRLKTLIALRVFPAGCSECQEM